MTIFSVLTPDIYEQIYSSKSYLAEFVYISKQFEVFIKEGNSSELCIEFGPGTGSMTDYVRKVFTNYTLVEPSGSFCDHLAHKYIDQTSLHIYQTSMQEYVLKILVPKSPLLACVFANFNVINYISQLEFHSFLTLLGSCLNVGSRFVFDTWSLEYVHNMPFCQELVTAYPDNQESSDCPIITRRACSSFDSDMSKLTIEFEFTQLVENVSTFLGNEVHEIYPFDINALKYAIGLAKQWVIISVLPHEAVRGESFHNQASDISFSNQRNWYITLLRV